MAQKAKRGKGNEVVIRLDQRAFYLIVGILGLLVVFFVGLYAGRTFFGSGGGTQQATLPQVSQQSSGVQQVDPNQLQDSTLSQPAGPQPRNPVSPDQRPIGDAPRLAIPEIEEFQYVYDFGEIPNDQPVEHTFEIKNIGNQPLEITDAKSSCGCTAALVSDQSIPAGETGTIKVTYDPRVTRDSGPISRFVRIESNDPAAPIAQFTIVATVAE